MKTRMLPRHIKTKQTKRTHHKAIIKWLYLLLVLLCFLSAGYFLGRHAQEEVTYQSETETILDQLEQQRAIKEGQTTDENNLPTDSTGQTYRGVLQIPALYLQLPVANTDNFAQMRRSPILYRGDFKEGTAVLCAHNYRSQFGNLYRLKMGDSIVVYDFAGDKHTYTVKESRVIQPTDSDQLHQEEKGLFLYTCTADGTRRRLIVATEVE